MITKEWDSILKEEYQKEYFKLLRDKVHSEYEHKIIFPKYNDIFTAFTTTTYENVKVVDGFDLVPNVDECFADGVHPNAYGSVHLANNIKEILKK